ncbi:TauD/TfdA family dioxygenase [Erythrobacteraceae bacterium WH01K]|nr:TauD/TfdA family dioxygenase [Erythrobacteraceae bacterium WH01K]
MASTPDTKDFPAVIHGQGDLGEFLSQQKTAVDDALLHAGTLLFRGFDVPDAGHFDAAVEGYGEDGFTYEESLSNAVRVNVTPRVFTANEAPPETEIHLHHEMAQTPIYPSKLFFYCEIAPSEGGATPVCRSDWLLERMRAEAPEVAERFAREGVRYTNVMPGADDAGSGQGRSWKSTLGAQTREDAERRLAALGYEWQWREDGSLRATTPVLPAIRELPDGRETFFNQLIAAFRGWSDARNRADKSVTFGDGTPVTAEDMAPAIEASEALTRDVEWQAGDVALLDNFLVMHGRRPFSGKRRVLASLVS